jgi:hypothetical protein
MIGVREIAAAIGVMAVALAAEAGDPGPAEGVEHGFAPVRGAPLR